VFTCSLTVDPQSDDDRQTARSPSSVDSRRRTLTDESIGAVVGSLATLAVLLFVVAGLLAWRRQRQFGVHRVLKCLDGPVQVTSAATRPPASPRHCAASQFNGTANGLAVAAKVPRLLWNSVHVTVLRWTIKRHYNKCIVLYFCIVLICLRQTVVCFIMQLCHI